MRILLALCLVGLPLAAQEKTTRPAVPSDVAAMDKDGKWTIRKADLYRYLVRYHGQTRAASTVLPEYMKRRMVEAEARKRKLSASGADVDKWLAELDKQVRERTGGKSGIEELRRKWDMTMADLRRRGKEWLLREKVARAIWNEKDPVRPKNKPVPQDGIVLAIDTLFHETPKELDRSKLPKGVVARIGKIEITEYEYGRELFFTLAATEMLRALNDLILVEATNQLIGKGEVAPEDMARQKRWFLTFEANRLARQTRIAPSKITPAMINQTLTARGLSLEMIYANAAFLAQARARGHFRRQQTDEKLKAYWTKNKARYGDSIDVQRIVIGARAQDVPGVGKKIRTLNQGKAKAQAVWIRANGGAPFDKLAKENSEDADVIRKNGGVIPIPITGATRGMEDTFHAANALKIGQISKPFFIRGQGYGIVKLLARRPAPPYEKVVDKVMADASEEAYLIWKNKVTRAAIKNPDLRKR